MWKPKFRVKAKTDDVRVQVFLPRAALTAIFDHCDRFDRDETGGRTIGTLIEENGDLTINVTGIIEAGPQAQRTSTFFLQDGKYQEAVFRDVETRNPEIEHLGNWHTHHVNGYPTLSGGDISTYHRIVNHHNHNIPFFYALLVTAKNDTKDPLHRYSVKHFLFRRGDGDYYEISAEQVKITNSPLLWPTQISESKHDKKNTSQNDTKPIQERGLDSTVITEFYPNIKPFSSAKLGIYWKGKIDLLDRSKLEVVLLEDESTSAPTYSLALRDPPEILKDIAEKLGNKTFSSARAALINVERACNHVLYQHRNNVAEKN